MLRALVAISTSRAPSLEVRLLQLLQRTVHRWALKDKMEPTESKICVSALILSIIVSVLKRRKKAKV